MSIGDSPHLAHLTQIASRYIDEPALGGVFVSSQWEQLLLTLFWTDSSKLMTEYTYLMFFFLLWRPVTVFRTSFCLVKT